jgi:putative two-component system response regulator
MPAKVLVVDDETANRELLTALLESEGFAVTAAQDGLLGLTQFQKSRPDIVLADVQMPNMDGFELCRVIKQNPATRLVPVVLVTALSDVASRVRGIEAGADDFLSKPVERVELVARVRSLSSIKAFTDELEHAELVLFALARSIEGKDPYTKGHCERLSSYGVELGKRIGLREHELTALARAGTVHDIGKVAVPDAVLLKPGKLTDEERRTMEQHSIVGEQICAPLKSFRLVLPIIRHHHEKFDGSGYPDHLRGEDIPVTARVLQVVDVYDALTTARPYKRALPTTEALDMMAEEVRKGWWDPEVFAVWNQLRRDLSPSGSSTAPAGPKSTAA